MFGSVLLHSGLRAETTVNSGGTEINVLPFTISSPGTYFLKQNFSSTFAAGVTAITVNASGVTIDLNGHSITNTTADATALGATTTNGIKVNGDHANVIIRNGSINGFQFGIAVQTTSTASSFYDSSCPSYGHLIENITFLKNSYCAIRLSGVGSRILRCRAILTGGNQNSSMNESFKLWGANNTIEDCDVSGKVTGATAYPSYGITVSLASNNFVINNRVMDVDTAIRSSSNGGFKYRDNIVSGVTTAWNGGIDAGNNVN